MKIEKIEHASFSLLKIINKKEFKRMAALAAATLVLSGTVAHAQELKKGNDSSVKRNDPRELYSMTDTSLISEEAREQYRQFLREDYVGKSTMKEVPISEESKEQYLNFLKEQFPVSDEDNELSPKVKKKILNLM